MSGSIASIKILADRIKGTPYEKPIFESAKKYFYSNQYEKDIYKDVIEFKNIFTTELKIQDEYSLYIILRMIFSGVHNSININAKDPVEAGQMMIRNVLMTVGVENERLVKSLGKECSKIMESLNL